MKVGGLGGLDGGMMWNRQGTSFQWQTTVANPDPVNPPLPLGLNNIFACSLVEPVALSGTVLKLVGIILFEGMTLLDPTVVTEKTGSGGNNYTQDLTETAVLADTVRAVAQTKQLTETIGLVDTPEVGAPVIWTSLYRTTASGTSVTNVYGANGWGPLAVGRQTLASGDGWVEWLETGSTAIRTVGFFPTIPPRLGLGTQGSGWSWYRSGANLYCSVNGSNAAGPFTASAGDRLRVAIESGVVKFYRNSVLIYTAGAASYPMYVWTHIYTNGGVTNATINGPFKPNNEIAYEPLGPLADTVTKQAGKVLTENLTLTDPTVVTEKTGGGATNYTKDLTETASLVDTLTKGESRALAETATLADTVRKGEGRALAELVTLTATPTKSPNRTLTTEAATLTATPTKGAGKQVTTQVATLTDTLRARAGTKQASELVTLLDTLRARAGTKQASETVVLTDAPTKATARTLTEGLALTDPTVTTQKGLAAASYSVTLTEDVVLSGGYLHVTELVITEDLGLSDELTANRLNPRPPITVTESLHLTDVVEARVVARVLPKSQSIRLTDTITAVRTRKEANPTEVVSLTATLTVARSATDRILTETILLRDAVSAPDMYADQEVLEFAGDKEH